MWEDGTTDDGHRVTIDIDPYLHPMQAKVMVDHLALTVLDVSRMRDGGTTTIHTRIATIVCPRRLGSEDRVPRIDFG